MGFPTVKLSVEAATMGASSGFDVTSLSQGSTLPTAIDNPVVHTRADCISPAQLVSP